jgi:hypothetical protein
MKLTTDKALGMLVTMFPLLSKESSLSIDYKTAPIQGSNPSDADICCPNMVLHEQFVLPANGSGPEQIHASGAKLPMRNSNRQATIEIGDGNHPVLQ